MKFKKAILIICFLLITNTLVGCGDAAKNSVVKKITSEDGKYTAIAFIRDGGATTAFSPQVSIIKKGKKFDDSTIGNVFIGNKSKEINIKWEDSKNLIIDCNDAEIVKREDKFGDITIKYTKITE